MGEIHVTSGRSHLRGCRVAFVVRDLGVGGAERQASLLARHLARQSGAEVEVWCFDHFGRNRQLLLESGIPIHHLPLVGEGSVFTQRLRLLRFVHDGRVRRPELLLPFTDYPNKVCCSLWPLLGARAAVWNQRDEGRERTGRLLERLALRQASLFVCNSRAGVTFLRTEFAVPRFRIVLVPNGLVMAAPTRTAGEWRHCLRLDDEQPLVVMVGNLHRFKDHRTLLHAWRRVLDRSEGAAPVLALAGRADTTKEELEELAARLRLGDALRFLGEIDDVPGLLSAAQLAVHSSHREGCPNGILEAMGSGLAVVATDIDGAREALGEQYPGLVPSADAEALAEAMLRVMAQPALRQRLATGNVERVRQHFDPQRNFDRYADVVGEVMAGRRPLDGRGDPA